MRPTVRSSVAVTLVLLLALAGCVSGPGTTTTDPNASSPAETTQTGPTVTLQAANGTDLATVSVTIADTQDELFTGLSDTESLGPNEGMLFVHDRERRVAYVMRDMAFPIDIIMADADGTVTAIHHASLEPNTSEENLTHYPGRALYVLEVNRGVANRTGLSVGDRLDVPDAYE